MQNRITAVIAVAGAVMALAPGSATAQKRDRDRITRQEIEASPHRNLDLYQVVRNLRPHFVEPPRGARSFGNSAQPNTPIMLYVDGKRDTGVDAMRSIDPNTVEDVRYLNPTAAVNEFGPQAANGAVVVKLKRKPRTPGDSGR